MYPFPLFLENIPTASLFSKVIVPVELFFPIPVSETNIPTPLSARISIDLLFSAFPLFWASIPNDLFAVAIAVIFALLVAVDILLLASFPSVNIPIPSSAFKLIFPELVLFSRLEPSLANIATDDLLFTSIIFSLTPVAFSLANIPILSWFVLPAFKVIVPVFTPFTLALVTLADLFVSIIPTDSLESITMLFSFFNVKMAELLVTVVSINPNIPADSSFDIVITAAAPSFVPVRVPPLASSNFI